MKPSSIKPAPALSAPSSRPLWLWALAAIGGLAVLGVALLILLMLVAGGSSAGKGCVGVISIKGELTAEDATGSLFSSWQAGSASISKLIEEADRRADVKAIVVEINSPGGSAVASREIYLALNASKKPKVAYFREMAASGGYYAAMGTDYIVSEPDALTGSVGVRSTFADLSGLFARLGYNETVVKSGELKDMGSPGRAPTQQELDIMQAIVNESFDEFRRVILASRGGRLKHPQFEQALDARILTGRQALAIGMVDEVGGKRDALAKANEMAGDKEMGVCEIQTPAPGLLSRLFSGSLALPELPRMSGGWQLQYD